MTRHYSMRPRTNFAKPCRYLLTIGIQKRREIEMFATIKRLIDQEADLAIPVTNLTPSATSMNSG